MRCNSPATALPVDELQQRAFDAPQLAQMLFDFCRHVVIRLSESEGSYFRTWRHSYELRRRGAADSDRVAPLLRLDSLQLGNRIA